MPYTRVSSSEILLTSKLEVCVSRTTVKFAELIKRKQLRLNINVGFYIGLYCTGHHRERQYGRLPVCVTSLHRVYMHISFALVTIYFTYVSE